MSKPPAVPSETVRYLNDDEINDFFSNIDHKRQGYINYSDLEEKLNQAYDKLVPQSSASHNFKHEHNINDRCSFLRNIMSPNQQHISREDFASIVQKWKIPSLQQSKKQEDEEQSFLKRLSSWRKLRAYWAVHGPEVIFIGLVVSSQLAFGTWQLVKYLDGPYVGAFGWGAAVAKACAGALYPTFFFIILSASRYFSTLLRRSYHISRLLNWDLSRAFHIRISCVALVLVTMHGLGHLTGTFVHGSDNVHGKTVAIIYGPRIGDRHYIDYIRSVPGFTGIAGLGLIYILCFLSIPQIRRWNYNIFQLGHVLVYPIIGLMMAHGTAALLQQPIFGYFLAFPTFLVLFERLSRMFSGFYRIKATLEVLDDETVEITVVIPKQRFWDYTAGQYIFLQVPEISFFQWHPFTISFCRGKKMTLHIKTDGDWTSRLRKLGGKSGREIQVGINGPFGAPAQRFHDFKYSVVIGAGIGITPFSAILADLQYNSDLDYGGPFQREVRPNDLQRMSALDQRQTEADTGGPSFITKVKKPQAQRRTDFHWIVRDGNFLMWLSNLLNKVSVSQTWHREHGDSSLDIRINTHVTAKRNDITTYIYSWLLEMHRTEDHPKSPLTGLLNPTSFGRPDFDKILDKHYEEMRRDRARLDGHFKANGGSEHCKVGVFYCGAAAVGEILAAKCSELNVSARDDGSKIEYHFMIEVFG